MKCLVALVFAAVLAITAARPQFYRPFGPSGSAGGSATGVNLPGFQQLNLNANAQSFLPANTGGVSYTGSVGFAGGTQTQLNGQGTSFLTSNANSQQHQSPYFGGR